MDPIVGRFVADHFGLIVVTAAILRPFFVLGHSVGRVYRRIAAFSSREQNDLKTLVDTIRFCFKDFKDLKLILRLDNLELPGAKILLGLFNMRNCSISLEEWWEIPRRETYREAALARYDERYKYLISTAAEKSGCKWFLSVRPSLERIFPQMVEDIMIRQRVWSRYLVAASY